jgi:carbon storage regulator CsrA
MLSLTRNKGQKVYINDNIVVVVMNVDFVTGQVRLGFEAPKDTIIDREEVHIRRKSGWTLPKHLSEDDAKCLLRHNTK